MRCTPPKHVLLPTAGPDRHRDCKGLSPVRRSLRERGRPLSAACGIRSFGDLARVAISGTMVGMKKGTRREFMVIVERDEDGYYVASVPELRGCQTQARSLDKLTKRVREAIALCLEVEDESRRSSEFIGVQRIAV
jgi:predicted RNase H-like HicB family nuclease